jgi:hypothetical protein
MQEKVEEEDEKESAEALRGSDVRRESVVESMKTANTEKFAIMHRVTIAYHVILLEPVIYWMHPDHGHPRHGPWAEYGVRSTEGWPGCQGFPQFLQVVLVTSQRWSI